MSGHAISIKALKAFALCLAMLFTAVLLPLGAVARDAQPPQLLWPVNAEIDAHSYENHRGNGADFPFSAGMREVYAAADGTVALAAWDDVYGNYLVLEHADGYTTLYAHCESLSVAKDDSVAAGQQIAVMGRTGMTTAQHLHFELMLDGASLDPMLYLSR